MSAEHYAVLGLARPRAGWFTEVGRWANSAALPIEFVRCVSVAELRVRLSGGRAWSALLVDQAVVGLERDLLDAAREAGCVTIVVTDEKARRDWVELGAAAVLHAPVDRDALLGLLRGLAAPLPRPAGSGTDLGDEVTPGGWEGRLVAVAGAGGTGTSTVAMAAAQGLAADPAHGGRIALVDAALDACLAVLHDTGDVVPGLQELVEAHRAGRIEPDAVRALTWHCVDRSYDLLLGLRRHRDWTALRPRAVEAAFASLRRSYTVTVVDVDAEVEGQRLTGSVDVEDRNALARHVTGSADLVLVTSTPTVTGLHRLVRNLDGLLDHGVEAERILPVVNQAPRSLRARAELTRAVADLLGPMGAALTTTPLFLTHRRDLDAVHRDAAPLPRAMVEPVTAAVRATLHRLEPRGADELQPVAVPVRPGSLGEGRSA